MGIYNFTDNRPNKLQPYVSWKGAIPQSNAGFCSEKTHTGLDVYCYTFDTPSACDSAPFYGGCKWTRYSTTPPATTSIVAANSRPLTKGDTSENPMNRKANPIKHWRKQLMPRDGSGHGKVSVGLVIDRPGGSHLVKKNCSLLQKPCSNTIKTYIDTYDSRSIVPSEYAGSCSEKNHTGLDIYCKTFITPSGCDSAPDYGGCKWTPSRAKICNRQRITRSASTIISKNYFTTTKSYLRNRVRLYDQNQTIAPKPGNNYLNNSSNPPNLLPPSNSNNGSQVYNSTNCFDNLYCTINPISIIYKPNNPSFSKEGSVSSSLRLQKIKYNTVTKSAKNLDNPWGQGASNNSRYRGGIEAPYINKSKFDLPIRNLKNRTINGRQPSGGVGRHNICCGIDTVPNSALVRKSGSILQSIRGTGTGILIPKQNATLCDPNGYTNNNNNILNKNRFLRNSKGCLPTKAQCKKWCVIPAISEIKRVQLVGRLGFRN